MPFGPEKYPLGAPDFGDPKAYEHIDHRPFTDLTFEEAEVGQGQRNGFTRHLKNK